jgi:outer membrane protein assembly factor BamB
MNFKLTLLTLLLAAGPVQANWPQFRGPAASGIATGPDTVEQWDLSSNKNIRWKVPIPGLAHSSPIIWSDKIFLTTAVVPGAEQPLKTGLYGDIGSVFDKEPIEWRVLCLSKSTGKVLWEKTLHKGMPKIKRHPKASHANSTPATDGKRIVAFFGAEGLYGLDMDGNLIWKKDLGELDSGYFAMPAAQWGSASSPVLYQDKVIVQCDVQKDSFIAVFDAKDGSQIWRTPRAEVPTWSTPAIITREGSPTQIVCNGWKQIAGYELDTGKLIWSMKGGGDIPVPTPISAHDLVFITNAHGPLSPIYALNLKEAGGDLTLPSDQTSSQHIAWSVKRGGNYMQTPIVLGEHLYLCLDNGMLTCIQAATGKQLYRQPLATPRKGFTASAVASGEKIYFTAEDGAVHVIAAGAEFKRLAENSMGEECMATPAISDGVIYFRTRNQLIAVGAN